MRSARRAASRTLWVTNSTVKLRARTSSSSSVCRASRVIASSAPNGSSIKRMSASWANARARAPRWRMPPDSWCGRLSPNPSRCTADTNWSTRARRSAFGTPARRSGSSMLAATVSHGKSADSWNIKAGRPATSTVPDVGVSSPATRLRIVDLPQPDVPIRQTNSPRPTSTSTSRSASTTLRREPNVLWTWRRVIKVPRPCLRRAQRAPR